MLAPSLYHFFQRQLQHGFGRRGLGEPDTIAYVSDILTRFAQTRELYALRDADGRPLEYLVDMHAAWRNAEGGRAQRRRIVRHIGEYSLFMSGIFRERLESLGQLDYYIANGSSAFWHCADHETSQSRHWRVFHRLHRDFAHIANALDRLRHNDFSADIVALPGLSPGQALWRL